MTHYDFHLFQGSGDSTSVCLHSKQWCLFLLSMGFVYFLVSVLSMLFTKESRRLREISLLHDNFIVLIILSSLLEWLVIAQETLSSGAVEIYFTAHQKIRVGTCRLIIFLYSCLQTSSTVALIFTIYARKCLLPNMNCIKPKPLCSIRLFAIQFVAGVIVAVTTILADISTTSGCCLHPFNAGGFEKTKDMIYNLSNVCAICLLLLVSTDKCLKLFLAGRRLRFPFCTTSNKYRFRLVRKEEVIC